MRALEEINHLKRH